jgi:hypothetical protein
MSFVKSFSNKTNTPKQSKNKVDQAHFAFDQKERKNNSLISRTNKDNRQENKNISNHMSGRESVNINYKSIKT